MFELPRVKVINPGDSWRGTECYINDQKIECVRSVDFRVAVDEVPSFTFETMGFPNIDMPAGDIRFSFTPETVSDASWVLLNELLKHDGLYNGFMASIKSALDDVSNDECATRELAEHILERIVGEG